MSNFFPSLLESPDYYEDSKYNKTIYWNEVKYKSVTFGWYDNKLYTSDVTGSNPKIHSNLPVEGAPCIGRSDFDYPGRLWLVTKVISFWKHPTKELLPKFLKELEKKLKIKFDESWKIEISKKQRDDEGWNTTKWELIPLFKYIGSAKLSAEELRKQHVVSPMEKMKRPKSSNYFKIGSKKEKPLPWKQALVKSESVKLTINENPDNFYWPKNAIPKNTKNISWADEEYPQRPFEYSYDDGNLWLGNIGAGHGGYRSTTIKGRIWPEFKVISFWESPIMIKADLKFSDDSIIFDLFKKLKQNGYDVSDWKFDGYNWSNCKKWKEKWGTMKDFLDEMNIKVTPQELEELKKRKKEAYLDHIRSPMLKKKKTVPAGFGSKNPDTKPLAWKQAMYAESYYPELNENPDNFSYKDNHYNYNCQGALAFEVTLKRDRSKKNVKDVIINKKPGSHASGLTELGDKEGKRFYPGRIYLEPKVITFWTYPSDEEFKDIISIIEKKLNIKIFNNKWVVEIYKDEGGIEKGKQNYASTYNNRFNTKEFLPVEEYISSEKPSEEEKAKHLLSYKEKQQLKKSSGWSQGFGSDKYASQKPLPWRQAMYAESYYPRLNEKILIGEPVSIEELRDILNDKILNFEFIKLDGEVRPAKGTTMMKYIPKDQHPTGDNPSSDKVASFYDLSKNVWRSVSNKSDEIVLLQDKDTGELKIRVSDKKPKEEPTKPEISKVSGADKRPIPPEIKPVVKPSIKPDVIPPTPKPIDIKTEPEAIPLDIKDPTINIDDIEDKDIIAPEAEKPEIEAPELDVEELPEEHPEKEDITFPDVEEEVPEEKLPPKEDITFPDDEEDEEDEDIL